ncbi:PA2778 family cysteine peptidase [Thalassotalea piscium]|uniref:Tetratricopeptide (TPR) repeat protein n=1 Tax=Thalassotalea piscium TaxID=1230533 RepID=A0A7X0NJ39_9GAMM|nr:PA2778 family cysteine peptidase [Thalassotalea piscium]MBB6544369.1 tetratricopeptide (TPR) repeat protein [Thalassotalea piscium]
MLIRSSTLFKLANKVIKVGIIASLFSLLGCATPPQTLQLVEHAPTNIPAKVNIQGVPFYPQQAYYCGPTTLAEVFEYNGVKQTPEQIAPQLFIPKRQGSLQLEMVAAIRQQGFLAYAKRGSLTELMDLVNQNIPVIVLQNLGLSWYPLWHYAVVKGYDLHTHEFILHSADIENRRVSMQVFERTWQRASFWFVAALTPTQSTTPLDDFTYISAAQDLISTGQALAAIPYLHNAIKAWPNNWLSYFLLANYYLEKDENKSSNLTKAIFWFDQGISNGQKQSHYLNNYAYARFKNGQIEEAKILINKAVTLSPTDENILATQKEIFATNN